MWDANPCTIASDEVQTRACPSQGHAAAVRCFAGNGSASTSQSVGNGAGRRAFLTDPAARALFAQFKSGARNASHEALQQLQPAPHGQPQPGPQSYHPQDPQPYGQLQASGPPPLPPPLPDYAGWEHSSAAYQAPMAAPSAESVAPVSIPGNPYPKTYAPPLPQPWISTAQDPAPSAPPYVSSGAAQWAAAPQPQPAEAGAVAPAAPLPLPPRHPAAAPPVWGGAYPEPASAAAPVSVAAAAGEGMPPPWRWPSHPAPPQHQEPLQPQPPPLQQSPLQPAPHGPEQYPAPQQYHPQPPQQEYPPQPPEYCQPQQQLQQQQPQPQPPEQYQPQQQQQPPYEQQLSQQYATEPQQQYEQQPSQYGYQQPQPLQHYQQHAYQEQPLGQQTSQPQQYQQPQAYCQQQQQQYPDPQQYQQPQTYCQQQQQYPDPQQYQQAHHQHAQQQPQQCQQQQQYQQIELQPQPVQAPFQPPYTEQPPQHQQLPFQPQPQYGLLQPPQPQPQYEHQQQPLQPQQQYEQQQQPFQQQPQYEQQPQPQAPPTQQWQQQQQQTQAAGSQPPAPIWVAPPGPQEATHQAPPSWGAPSLQPVTAAPASIPAPGTAPMTTAAIPDPTQLQQLLEQLAAQPPALPQAAQQQSQTDDGAASSTPAGLAAALASCLQRGRLLDSQHKVLRVRAVVALEMSQAWEEYLVHRGPGAEAEAARAAAQPKTEEARAVRAELLRVARTVQQLDELFAQRFPPYPPGRMEYASSAAMYEAVCCDMLSRGMRPRTDGRGGEMVLAPLAGWGASRGLAMQELLRLLRPLEETARQRSQAAAEAAEAAAAEARAIEGRKRGPPEAQATQEDREWSGLGSGPARGPRQAAGPSAAEEGVGAVHQPPPRELLVPVRQYLRMEMRRQMTDPSARALPLVSAVAQLREVARTELNEELAAAFGFGSVEELLRGALADVVEVVHQEGGRAVLVPSEAYRRQDGGLLRGLHNIKRSCIGGGQSREQQPLAGLHGGRGPGASGQWGQGGGCETADMGRGGPGRGPLPPAQMQGRGSSGGCGSGMQQAAPGLQQQQRQAQQPMQQGQAGRDSALVGGGSGAMGWQAEVPGTPSEPPSAASISPRGGLPAGAVAAAATCVQLSGGSSAASTASGCSSSGVAAATTGLSKRSRTLPPHLRPRTQQVPTDLPASDGGAVQGAGQQLGGQQPQPEVELQEPLQQQQESENQPLHLQQQPLHLQQQPPHLQQQLQGQQQERQQEQERQQQGKQCQELQRRQQKEGRKMQQQRQMQQPKRKQLQQQQQLWRQQQLQHQHMQQQLQAQHHLLQQRMLLQQRQHLCTQQLPTAAACVPTQSVSGGVGAPLSREWQLLGAMAIRLDEWGAQAAAALGATCLGRCGGGAEARCWQATVYRGSQALAVCWGVSSDEAMQMAGREVLRLSSGTA